MNPQRSSGAVVSEFLFFIFIQPCLVATSPLQITTMPPKKVFAKPTKRPPPVLAQPAQDVDTPAPADAVASESTDTAAALPNAEHAPPQHTESGPSTTPQSTRPAATVTSAPIAIGASMRRASDVKPNVGGAGGEAPTKPKVVFKPSMPTRKPKAE